MFHDLLTARLSLALQERFAACRAQNASIDELNASESSSTREGVVTF